MSKHTKLKNQMHKGPATAPPVKNAGRNGMRWIVLALGLILAAVGSWALMEFVVWNKVLWGEMPAELVGQWEVVQGPPEFKDAVFEFNRSGKMVGHLNDNGNLRVMNAEVRVEEMKLYITTRHPKTGAEHLSVQVVRKLSEREFIVADEHGTITKMTRMRN